MRSNFKKNQEKNLKDLERFFKEYMPCYRYKHLNTEEEEEEEEEEEDDDYNYYQTLYLPYIKRGFMGLHCNYGTPLKEIDGRC